MPEMTKTDNLSEPPNVEKYIVFSIMDKLYSFQSRYVGEITLFDTVYPLPLLPPYILGVVNRYSIPYALFDIEMLLFKTPGKRNKILVVKESIDRIAFLIDDVAGIVDIQSENLINIERNIESKDLAEAVFASFEWNGSNVFVLDIHAILDRVTAEVS